MARGLIQDEAVLDFERNWVGLSYEQPRNRFIRQRSPDVTFNDAVPVTVDYLDSGTATLGLVPSSTDTADYVETATEAFALTPSTVSEIYGREFTDTAMETLTLTPSGVEVKAKEYAEVGTLRFLLQALETSYTDDFNDNSLDPHWYASQGIALEQNSRMEFLQDYVFTDPVITILQRSQLSPGPLMTSYQTTVVNWLWDPTYWFEFRTAYLNPDGTSGVFNKNGFMLHGDSLTGQITDDIGAVATTNNVILAHTLPLYLKIIRTYPGLALQYSTDGSSWATLTSVAVDYAWMRKAWPQFMVTSDAQPQNDLLAAIDDFIAINQIYESVQRIYTDTATELFVLTPSATEIRERTDTNTEVLALIPSAVEIRERVDTGTEVFALTPSGVDLPAKEYVEAATEVFALTPSAVEIRERVDSGTENFALTPSAVEVKAKEYVETATEVFALTPSSAEIAQLADSGIEAFALTPSGTEFKAIDYTDAAVEVFALTPSAIEIREISDANTEVFALTPSGADVYTIGGVNYTDTATEAFALTPSGTEFAAKDYTETATVGLLLTPAPGLGVTDNFNRANSGSLGAGWTPFTTDGGLSIVGNEVVATSAAHLGNYRNAESYANDQFGEVTVTATALASGDFMGPIVRARNNGRDFYTVFYFNNPSDGGTGHENLYLYKRVNDGFAGAGGGFLSFGQTKVEVGTLSPGDKIRIEATGQIIKAYLNGVLMLTAIDIDHASGAPGVFAWGAGHLDNFRGGDLPLVIVADDFNRADGWVGAGIMGASWSNGDGTSGPNIVSNRVVGVSGSTDGTWRRDGTFGSDQASQITDINISTSGTWFGVNVRKRQGGNDYLAICFNNGGTPEVRLYKTVAGSFTQLGSTYTIPGGVVSASDKLRIEAVGSTITAKWNDTSVVSVTDTTWLSGGAPGITTFGVASADNWRGQNLGAGDIAVFVDTQIVGLALTPSGVDVQTGTAVTTDAATEILTLTPSSVETAQFVDDGVENFKLLPSVSELTQWIDANTETLALTPIGTEIIAAVDAVIENFKFGISDTQLANLVDQAIESLILSPITTSETAQLVDVSTETFALTPSGVEAQAASGSDAGVELFALKPSAAIEVAATVDANTATVALVPSAVEVRERTDANTEAFALTPSSVETTQFVDTSVEALVLTPSTVETLLAVDTAIELFKLTASGVEGAISPTVDTATINLVFGITSVDVIVTVETGIELFKFTPSSVDVYTIGPDAAVEYLALTPAVGVLKEVAVFVDAATVWLRLIPSSVEVYVPSGARAGSSLRAKTGPSHYVAASYNRTAVGAPNIKAAGMSRWRVL